jgi:hypothetical protein
MTLGEIVDLLDTLDDALTIYAQAPPEKAFACITGRICVAIGSAPTPPWRRILFDPLEHLRDRSSGVRHCGATWRGLRPAAPPFAPPGPRTALRAFPFDIDTPLPIDSRHIRIRAVIGTSTSRRRRRDPAVGESWSGDEKEWTREPPDQTASFQGSPVGSGAERQRYRAAPIGRSDRRQKRETAEPPQSLTRRPKSGIAECGWHRGRIDLSSLDVRSFDSRPAGTRFAGSAGRGAAEPQKGDRRY